MRILILTPYFPPDSGPSAPMIGMLAEDLFARGYQIEVIAAAPHYPSGKATWNHRGKLFHRSIENNIPVSRVWIPAGNRSSLVHRAMTFLVFQLLASIAVLFTRCDLILATNPAIETGLPFWLVAGLLRKPGIWLVWDLYPEVGIRLGLFRSRPVSEFVRWMEDRCLRAARRVQALSAEFLPYLARRVDDPGKLTVIPPWLDTDFIQPLPRKNEFSRQFGLDDYSVVMYAGNLGRSQGLEQVLESARHLHDEKMILFVFVGDGVEKDALRETARRERLENVRFISYQPQSRLPEILASADVSLVSLKPGLGDTAIPSKTLSIMASSRPLIAITEPDGVLAVMIKSAGAGIYVKPGCSEDLSHAVLRLYTHPLTGKEMGLCGRRYVLECHTRRQAADSFAQLINAIELELG